MSHSLRSRTKAPEAAPAPVTSPATPSKKADNFPLPPSPALASRPQRNRNLPKGYSNFVMPPIAKPNGVGHEGANGTTDDAPAPPTRQTSGASSPSSSPKQAPTRLSPQLLSASNPALTPLLSALIGSPSLPPASLSSFPSPLVSTKDGGDLQLSPALRSSAGFLKSPALSALASFRSSLPRRDSTNSVSGYLNLDKDRKGDLDAGALKGSPILASFQALSSPAIMSKKGLAAMSPLLPPLGSEGSKGEPRALSFSKKDSKADGANGTHTNGTSLYSPAFPAASYPSPGFSSLLRSPNVSPTLPPFPSPGIPALGPLCSPVLRSALSSSPLGLMPLSALNSSSSPLLGSNNGLSLSSPLLSSLWHSNNALTLSPLLSSLAGNNGHAMHGAAEALGRKRRAQSDADDAETKDEPADKKQALTDLRWTDPSGVTSLSFRRNRSANSLNSEHDGSKQGSQENAEDEEGDADMGSDEGDTGEHIKDNMDPMVTNGLLHDHEAVNSLSSLAALVSTKHMSSSASTDSVKVEPSSNLAPNPKPSSESATQSVSVSGTGLTGPSASAANGANAAASTPREPLNTANLPGINLPAYKPHNGFPLDSDVLLASIAAVLSGKTKELSNINRMLPLHHYRPCLAQTPAHLKKGIAAKPELEPPADMGGNDSLDLGDDGDPLSDSEYDVKGLTPKAGNGSGSSCHQCKSRRHMSHLIFCCNMFAKRNGKGKRRICRKKYCWQCLQKFYQEQPPKKRQDPSSTWQCPSCRSICCCALCRRVRQEKTDHQNVDPAMSLAFGFVYFNKIDQLGHDSKFRLDVLWRKWLSLSPAATNEIADLGDLSEIEIQQPTDGSPAQSPSNGGSGLSSIKLPSNIGGVKLEMRN